MTHSLLQLAGLEWPVPHYSMLSRRQKTLRVAIEVMATTSGLHLSGDSTGIKTEGNHSAIFGKTVASGFNCSLPARRRTIKEEKG